MSTAPRVIAIDGNFGADYGARDWITHQDYFIVKVTFDQPVQFVSGGAPVPGLQFNSTGDSIVSVGEYLNNPTPNSMQFLYFAGAGSHNVPELKITGLTPGSSIVAVDDGAAMRVSDLTHFDTHFPAVDLDRHYTAAQVQQAEANHTDFAPHVDAWNVDLRDTPKAVADLLGGHTWADVMNNITKMQATGIDHVEVQLPQNHEFEFALSDAFHLAEQQLALHGTESVAQQTKEIAQVEHHDWHL